MKFNKKMQYLKTNVKTGTSKKGNPYEIVETTFMDDEYEQITVTVAKEVARNHRELLTGSTYDVTFDVTQRGWNKAVELQDFKEVKK